MTITTDRRCGTRRSYDVHRKRGEEPCQPCRDANNAYHRAYARTRQAMRRATNAAATLAAYRPAPRPVYRTLPGGVIPAEAIAAEVADSERQAS